MPGRPSGGVMSRKQPAAAATDTGIPKQTHYNAPIAPVVSAVVIKQQETPTGETPLIVCKLV